MEEGSSDRPSIYPATRAALILFRPQTTQLPFLDVRLSRSDGGPSAGREPEITQFAVFRIGTLSRAEILTPPLIDPFQSYAPIASLPSGHRERNGHPQHLSNSGDAGNCPFREYSKTWSLSA